MDESLATLSESTPAVDTAVTLQEWKQTFFQPLEYQLDQLDVLIGSLTEDLSLGTGYSVSQADNLEILEKNDDVVRSYAVKSLPNGVRILQVQIYDLRPDTKQSNYLAEIILAEGNLPTAKIHLPGTEITITPPPK